MTVLDLPEPELFAVDLEPHQRVVLGAADSAPTQPARLALGRPVLKALSLDTLDDEARQFLADRKTSRFVLLTLTASFTRDDEKPFTSAWLDLSIRCPEAVGVDPPIAWSMAPRSESDVLTVSRKVTLDASLKLTLPGSVLEVGPEVSRDHEEQFSRNLIKLEALNEGTSSPRWVFYPTDATAIGGIHRLCAVIELPAATPGSAQVSMGATIRLRRMKVFRYDAALADVPEVAVVNLPAG